VHCAVGAWGGRRPSLTGYVTVTGPQQGAPASRGRSCCLLPEACEAGKGWDGCKEYCKPGATFSAQAEPLADTRTLRQYTDWMKGLLTFMPDGRYALKSFATDEDRNSVCAYGVFSGTHTGAGGPCPPTGKRVNTDYV
jgi:hypothetical protein